MNQEVEVFVPVLFWILAGFALLNIIINLVLLYIRQERINILLSIFWPIVLVVFLIQSYFQQGDLAVILAFGASFVSLTLVAIIGFEIIGRPFPLRAYLLFYCFTIVLTLIFFAAGFPFEVTAMPVGIGTGSSLLHFAWYTLYRDRQRTTRLQKLLACSFIVSAVHGINFALFRMDPGAQLWGWMVAYAVYDSFAIILPALALENVYLNEKQRLENLIRERTAALDKSLEQNRGLLKILMHDIHNPLSAMGMSITALRSDVAPGPKVLANLQGSHDALEGIIASVREMNHNEASLAESEWINLEECCREAIALFASSLESKQLTVHFTSSAAEDCRVRLNRNLFIHSVLGNLLGNAIKFSRPGSTIGLQLRDEADLVVLEVSDDGEGISSEVLEQLGSNQKVPSTAGTQGETGMGLGLSIVKSIVESFDGRLTFEQPRGATPDQKGTHAVVTFGKTVAQPSDHDRRQIRFSVAANPVG